jgi:hypothetical protein
MSEVSFKSIRYLGIYISTDVRLRASLLGYKERNHVAGIDDMVIQPLIVPSAPCVPAKWPDGRLRERKISRNVEESIPGII